MRQTDDYDNPNGSLPILYMALAVSIFILVIIGIVIATNKKPKQQNPPVLEESSQAEEFSTTDLKLTADDLDIWDMYPTDESTEAIADDELPTEEAVTTEESSTEEIDTEKFIYIQYLDGSDERVPINPYIEKHNYDFTNLLSKDGRLQYANNGKEISRLGVDLSRYQKDVDFNQLKQDGIEFVMLRVAARGYKTGELKLDECFEQNIKKATEAGLNIGLYIYSQAITVEEAVAEAQFILDHIGEYKINYPIAIDMEFVDNDHARVESLTRDERTAVTAAFVNKIREAGYTPMIYGNTEWLVKRIDLSKFSDCCIWLAEENDLPNYPYQFEMWQYTTKGQVKGIPGYVDLNISFIDYSAR